MILQHAASQQEIRSFMNKSLLNMNATEIQGWMHHRFDGNNMYCRIQNDQIVSALQLEHTSVRFQGQEMAACQIILGATHPDFRKRKYFSQLLDAALDQAKYNELMTIVHTDFPKLFISHGFIPISHTVTYWASLQDFSMGNAQNIVPYRESMDLYPLYLQFIHTFDGSKTYTKKQFMKRICYAQSIRKKILVIMDPNNHPHGFMICSQNNTHISIECMVYLNSAAILDGLAYLAKRTNSVAITISENECLDKITHLDYPREKGTTLVHINHPKLFSRWANQTIKNAKDAYKLLERPDWNHF